MKNQYNSETQTLVGTKRRKLVDTDTGEIVHVDQITKRVYGNKQFWKVYLMDFLSILGIVDSKQLDIFIYILEHTDQANNLYIGTYKKIAEETKASSRTISKIMKKLQENNFIAKVQNGVYRVNPNVLMKGNENKRQILLSYYEEEKQENTRLEVARGKHTRIDEPLKNQIAITEIMDNED